MKVLPLNKRLFAYLKKRQLQKRFEKQKLLFEKNPFHPSLRAEILEPKHLRLYSFRLTQKYRVILFIAEILPLKLLISTTIINNNYFQITSLIRFYFAKANFLFSPLLNPLKCFTELGIGWERKH